MLLLSEHHERWSLRKNMILFSEFFMPCFVALNRQKKTKSYKSSVEGLLLGELEYKKSEDLRKMIFDSKSVTELSL